MYNNSSVVYWEESKTTYTTFIIFFIVLCSIVIFAYIYKQMNYCKKKPMINAGIIEILNDELSDVMVGISDIELNESNLPQAILIDSRT